MAAVTPPPVPSAGPDERVGMLFCNGVFVAAVHYTLVAVEREGSLPIRDPERSIYTSVIRLAPDAFAAASRIGTPGQVFELETDDGQRLACRPLQMLDGTRLRWIVQLT